MNKGGKTALDCARDKNKQDIIEILEQAENNFEIVEN